MAHRMRPRLIQLGRSFFHDEELAEDAVQETLLRLWLLRKRIVGNASERCNPAVVGDAPERCIPAVVGDASERCNDSDGTLGSVPHYSPAEALLVRLMKNVCVNEWRRRQKHGAMSVEVMGSVLSQEAQPMADDDNQRMLQQAIRSLSPQERRLFRRRHELGMDVPQIAAATGMLSRSVSQVVSVARRKIVEQLKKGGIL